VNIRASVVRVAVATLPRWAALSGLRTSTKHFEQMTNLADPGPLSLGARPAGV
jgi:hypothetical protein